MGKSRCDVLLHAKVSEVIMLASAFVLGWVGSLHCVVMCGPLVEVMSHRKGHLAYHAGRLLMYALLGMTFGYFGQQLSVYFSQQILTQIAGLFLLILAFWPSHWFTISPQWTKWQKPIRQFFVQKRQANPQVSEVGMGLLNGLIPCGLIYAALAGATQFQYTWQSGLYMVLFGLGTLPALLSGGMIWNKVIVWIRTHFRYAIPATYAVMGLLLLWRGSSLEIKLESEGFPITICHAPQQDTSGESD